MSVRKTTKEELKKKLQRVFFKISLNEKNRSTKNNIQKRKLNE